MVVKSPIIYPSSDGQRMAENTLQFQWIVTIKCGLEVVFQNDPNVFVAGDLLWYPVEGEPRINAAPDAMVVFGRPKGHRPSYMQWLEGGIGPQVAFEVLSPSNTYQEMSDKMDYYDTYGVEEYYVYNPDRKHLQGWLRQGTVLRQVYEVQKSWTSPRLKVKFEMGAELILIGPDGRRFLTYEELANERDNERKRADDEHRLAEEQSRLAELLRRQIEELQERTEKAEAKEAAMRERLRSLGIEETGG